MLKLLYGTSTTIVFLIFFVLLPVLIVCSGQIEPSLFRHLNEDKLRYNIFVSVKEDKISNILANLGTRFSTGRIENAQKSEIIMRELKLNSEYTKGEIIDQISDFARHEGAEVKSYWINNLIYVKGATRELIKYISELPRAERIFKEREIELFESSTTEPRSENSDNNGTGLCQEIPTWGIKKINADKVWDLGYHGENVTVGILDTGVLYYHAALEPNWNGPKFGYMDLRSLVYSRPDYYGPGTAAAGTAVGINGIGVAPGAKWMGCSTGRLESELLKCAEWMICPHNTNYNGEVEYDCSKAPQVINNSWGLAERNPEIDIFKTTIEAWKTAGIIPVFALGDKDYEDIIPTCDTALLPARSLADVISVGNTIQDDSLDEYSPTGTSAQIQVPDLSAPGKDILTAYHLDDRDYVHITGTGMAAPHVTGVIALMLGVNPQLTFDQVQSILAKTAEQNLKFTNRTCGGGYDNEFPNTYFGYGRIDAYAAVQAVINGDY